MAIISEVIHRLQLNQFSTTTDCHFNEIYQQTNVLNQLFMETNLNTIKDEWNKLVVQSSDLFKPLEKFRQEGKATSLQFLYWDTFLDSIYPVLRDLTRSQREGDWDLYLSAIQRALPLTFAFDRVNYKRWLPLYYEDCISLKSKFPLIYESFINSDSLLI